MVLLSNSVDNELMQISNARKKIQLNHDWVLWIQDNLKRNCRFEDIQNAMIKDGFSREDAFHAIKTQQRHLQLQVQPPVPPMRPQGPVKGHLSLVTHNSLVLDGRRVPLVFEMKSPRIRLFDQFLSSEECDLLIAKSKTHLTRSLAVDPVTGQNKKFAQRTSEGTFFSRGEPGLVASIEKRCEVISGYPAVNGECLQILRYDVGAEYQPHYDYFDPKHPGSAQQLVDGGQRVATVLMYLNEVPQGGDTYFPEIGFSVRPKKGQALLFFNLDPMNRLDPLSQHAGRPVISGEKWVATRWIRLQARKN